MWDLGIDSRMSKEWNQVMRDLIRQTECSQLTFKGEHYRNVTSDEVSEPNEFQWNSEVWEEPIT